MIKQESMIKSMTGFGRAESFFNSRKISVELRCLNSKQLDITARLPNGYREKENELRSLVSGALQRGKIELIVICEENQVSATPGLNKPLALQYYTEISELASELAVPGQPDIFGAVLRIPDIYSQSKDVIGQDEWEVLFATVAEALEKADHFRTEEGTILENEFITRTGNLLNLLKQVEPFEIQRILTIRTRMEKELATWLEKETADKNRFEQELVYYFDKLDITEEKTRLGKHCDYFLESLKADESNGKKLIFITQEMGREINTIGSKANDSDIQRIVVEMKDELEKIREQLGNIL